MTACFAAIAGYRVITTTADIPAIHRDIQTLSL